jgi:hypothetical protein
MLPTANNRANNSIPRRLDTQFENHFIFTTVACHKLPEDMGRLRSIIMDVLMDVSSQCSGTSNPLSQLNWMVDSWYTKRNANHDSTSIFDKSIGEDGLSIQSTYDANIDNPYHTGSLPPNSELMDSQSMSDFEYKDLYTILAKRINELWVQLSTNKTLLSVDKRGWTFNTYIAEVLVANTTLPINDIELYKWAVNNKFARCWYCQDLHNCSDLKVAIKKAIHKSPHDVQQRHLFYDEDDGQQIQFLGFVSSHRTVNVFNSLHIHSLAVFYTDKQKCTIVTCILTSRVHILTNMQDCVLQLMQLIQFWSNGNFETAITNNFMGHDVVLDKISRNGYESMGFDTTPLTQDTEHDLFTIKTHYPIPLASYYDRYTWAKYGHHLLPSTISLNVMENLQTHSTYCNSLQQLHHTD